LLAAGLAILAAGAAQAAQSASAREEASCRDVRAGWARRADGTPELVVINRIRVSRDGALTWNGAPVTRAILNQYLGFVRAMEPMPFTILIPDRDTDCAAIETIRDLMEAALPCRDGACGEGRGSWPFAPALQRSDPEADGDLANAAAEAAAADDDPEAH
jgi:hypothetical protein